MPRLPIYLPQSASYLFRQKGTIFGCIIIASFSFFFFFLAQSILVLALKVLIRSNNNSLHYLANFLPKVARCLSLTPRRASSRPRDLQTTYRGTCIHRYLSGQRPSRSPGFSYQCVCRPVATLVPAIPIRLRCSGQDGHGILRKILYIQYSHSSLHLQHEYSISPRPPPPRGTSLRQGL